MKIRLSLAALLLGVIILVMECGQQNGYFTNNSIMNALMGKAKYVHLSGSLAVAERDKLPVAVQSTSNEGYKITTISHSALYPKHFGFYSPCWYNGYWFLPVNYFDFSPKTRMYKYAPASDSMEWLKSAGISDSNRNSTLLFTRNNKLYGLEQKQDGKNFYNQYIVSELNAQGREIKQFKTGLRNNTYSYISIRNNIPLLATQYINSESKFQQQISKLGDDFRAIGLSSSDNIFIFAQISHNHILTIRATGYDTQGNSTFMASMRNYTQATGETATVSWDIDYYSFKDGVLLGNLFYVKVPSLKDKTNRIMSLNLNTLNQQLVPIDANICWCENGDTSYQFSSKKAGSNSTILLSTLGTSPLDVNNLLTFTMQGSCSLQSAYTLTDTKLAVTGTRTKINRNNEMELDAFVVIVSLDK